MIPIRNGLAHNRTNKELHPKRMMGRPLCKPYDSHSKSEASPSQSNSDQRVVSGGICKLSVPVRRGAFYHNLPGLFIPDRCHS